MTEAAPTALRFRSARRSILAAYLGHAVGILLGGLGIGFVTQMLPEEWRWVGPLLIALIVVSMLVGPPMSYGFTRYTLTADTVVEETGWLDRRVKTLRWSSVQAIDRSTEWQLRPFGLADLTIAQAGHEASKIVIRGIDASTVERVLELSRVEVGAEVEPARQSDDEAGVKPGDAQGSSEAEVLYRASVWELVVMSLMFGAAVVAAPVMAFGLWEIAEQFGLQAWLSGVIGGLGPIGAAILAGVVVIVMSVAKTVLIHFRFEVRRVGDELRISHGLVITHERAFREASIQGVVLQRNLLEQCTGRARLWLLTLDSNEQLGKNLVLPSLPVGVVERIAREAFPSRVPLSGSLLSSRPPILMTFLTTVLAIVTVAATYLALTVRLDWHPLLAGAVALLAFAAVSAVCRVLLARLDIDSRTELLLLRRTYLTESLRSVDIAAVRRVSAWRLPRWLTPHSQRLLPSAAIYAGKAVTLRALRADAAAIERLRVVIVAHAPAVAAATLARHRA